VACREFHARFPSLFYPGGDDALSSLRTGDRAAIQSAVDFIVADPQHFRSGYTKEYVWVRLRSARCYLATSNASATLRLATCIDAWIAPFGPCVAR
jgi:hypothetical protein